MDSLAKFVNRLSYRLIWELTEDAAPLPTHATSSAHAAGASASACALRRTLRDASVHLLALLAERDARKAFCPSGAWLIPELRYSEVHRELLEHKPRAKRLLHAMPWALPFERRVNLFRELVQQEKDALPNEALPEHVRGTRIKIRREQLLEDGYVYVP